MSRAPRHALAGLLAVVCAVAPATAHAQSLWTGTTGTTTGTYTSNTCPAVTPVIHSIALSAPTTGSGATCTSDAQCSGAGEFCSFGSNLSQTGSCRASGLLQRENIAYVAGGTLDVEVTIPTCTGVRDVQMDGASLTSSGGIDSSTAATWYGVSSTTVRLPSGSALRQRIRVQFPNFGDGLSNTLAIVVGARTGTATTSTSFTLARVAAVNAPIRATVAETSMRNDFVATMYRTFGDGDQIFDEDGERIGYGLDWSELGAIATPSGIQYTGTDLRIGSGQLAFSTQFTGDGPVCDGPVSVDGWFTLVPNGDGVDIRWIVGPRLRIATALHCQILSLGLSNVVAAIFADEDAIEDQIAESISLGFGADENGHIKICELCRVVDVRIGNGLVDVYTVPPADRVRVNASTERRTDVTADPTQGLALPARMFAPLAVGGSYETCGRADGTSPATCSPRFVADMDGLFNWSGADVPVPSPIACNEYGHCGVIAARQSAWARLRGLSRDVTKLPSAAFPAGALLARRTPADAMKRVRVSNGCLVSPLTVPYKLSFGVNDIATPVTGAPPTRGRLDVTVILAATPEQSEVLFAGLGRCQLAP